MSSFHSFLIFFPLFLCNKDRVSSLQLAVTTVSLNSSIHKQDLSFS